MRTCNKCGETKPLEMFGKHKGCAEGRTPTCRACNYAKQKEWIEKNKDHVRKRERERAAARKETAVKHYGGKCHDCGVEYPPCVFDFHHLDPSQKDVNPSQAIGRNPEKMWEELDKCVMVCANCHRLRHYGGK